MFATELNVKFQQPLSIFKVLTRFMYRTHPYHPSNSFNPNSNKIKKNGKSSKNKPRCLSSQQS